LVLVHLPKFQPDGVVEGELYYARLRLLELTFPQRFDVVSMMFCMHYAFESEAKCRNMLRNVSSVLKKGGRFIGTIPSSDIISSRVQGKHLPPDSPEKEKLENSEHGIQEWGNSIYRVRFAEEPPKTGVFRPPWGWRYNFFLEEAVEEVPEYVVPWEAFRAYVLLTLCFFFACVMVLTVIVGTVLRKTITSS
jgi:SAM-dependent methyltransferase